MINENFFHTSVLMNEVLEHLSLKQNGIYVDATFGRGGHARAILDRLSPAGRLLAIDKDPLAIAYARQHFSHDPRFMIQQGSFATLQSFIQKENLIGKVDGILFDLGVSSPQLDDAARGFSFQRTGKLDMRMDNSQGLSAADWVAHTSEEEIANGLYHFGEERFSRRIARAIVTERAVQPIETTEQLATIIARAVPVREKGKHPATRSFQAIRIIVNNELDDLQKGLDQSLEALTVGGRLLVISFHSLEDRIVKHFIQDHERGNPLPPGLPIKFTEFKSRLKRVGKAIKPTSAEIANNPRARSAVLRISEKQS